MISIIKVLVLCHACQYAQAAELAQSILSANRKRYQCFHSSTSDAMFVNGFVQQQLGNLPQALALYQEAYAMRLALMPACNPALVISQLQIASLLEVKSAISESMSWLERAQATSNELMYQDKLLVTVPQILEGSGRLCHLQKNFTRSRELLLQALELKQLMYGGQHPCMISCLVELAQLHMKQKMQQQAFTYLNQAIEIAKKNYGQSHPMLAKCFDNLGDLYKQCNNFELALKLYQNSLTIKYRIHGPACRACHCNACHCRACHCRAGTITSVRRNSLGRGYMFRPAATF